MWRDKKPFVMQTQALDLVFELIDCYYKVTSKKTSIKLGKVSKEQQKIQKAMAKK